MGTRGLRDAARRSQQTQDATHRAKAEAHLSKEVEAAPNDLDLRPSGHSLSVALTLAQAAVGRFEALRGLSALRFDPREWLTQGTVVVAALLGFGLPRVAAVGDGAKWTPRLRSLTSPHGGRAWGGRLGWTWSERRECWALRCPW